MPAEGDGSRVPPVGDGSRLLLGVGDRLTFHADDAWRSLRAEALRLGLPLDLLQVWLPRGWEDAWIEPEALARLAHSGTTPVVVHAFFGDAISRERVQAERTEWLASVRRMARRIAVDAPVLVILEPEFNNRPPRGETAITDWPGFSDALRRAVGVVREEAPRARVGTCAGDYSPSRELETPLRGVAESLDFLCFQEMRGRTRPDAHPDGLALGRAALSYARYLDRTFGRPVLLGYVAVSSWGGWEEEQARALRSLAERREALRAAGVFGLVYFQLRDDPHHAGWFGPAERHFGLTTASGEPKPALRVFRALGEASRPRPARPRAPRPRSRAAPRRRSRG